MRVTQRQLQGLAVSSVTDSRSRLLDAQEKAASGQNVVIPSDDPAASSRARLLRELMAEATSHQRNINYGNIRLQRAEQALTEAGRMMSRAKELALAMANETLDASQRTTTAEEVQVIRQIIIDLANTKDGDEFIFAHVQTTTAPIASDGSFTYDVDTYDEIRRAEVGPGSYAEIGAGASQAFAQRASDAQSVDVFDVLNDLSAALTANDPDAIRATIDDIDSSFTQILAERTRIGSRMNRLESAKSSSEQSHALYETLESDLIDADAADAFSELTLAETGLQAAIGVASRLMRISLLDSI